MKYLFTVVSLLALASCGGTPVKQASCGGNDWHALGVETGTKGESVRVFDQYIEGCPLLKKKDKKLFIDGFREGIKTFCNYENGYKLAMKDRPDPKNCPYELRADFDRGYKQGSIELMQQKDSTRKLQNESEERRMRGIDQLDRDQNRSLD